MLGLKQHKTIRAQVPATRVRQWFAAPAGAALCAVEQQLLQQALVRLFGSYLLYYNPVCDGGFSTQVRYRLSLGDAALQPQLQCAERYWPVQPEGADVVVLQHSLEFAQTPYDLLREAARAVRPGGHLIVVGLNPTAPLGWRYRLLCPLWRKAAPLSAARLGDWLQVLGFRQEQQLQGAYTPASWQSLWPGLEAFLHRRQWPGGSCYMLVARKRMHAATIQPARSKRAGSMLPLSVAHRSTEPDWAKEKNQHE